MENMEGLQEAPFACFGDGNIDMMENDTIPTKTVTHPINMRVLPPHIVSKASLVECTGSGTCYFHRKSLKDRFICWRVCGSVIILREWSLQHSLSLNGLRLQLPGSIVPKSIHAEEAWDNKTLQIACVTHVGTIHQFFFPLPEDISTSIFADFYHTSMDTSTQHKRLKVSDRCNTITLLKQDEIITCAAWINEFNLVVATDIGNVFGVNFGVPDYSSEIFQNFRFTDEISVVSWLWNGILGKDKQNLHQENVLNPKKILAITHFQVERSDIVIDDGGDVGQYDLCIVTISADFNLRAYSFQTQSCLGNQNIRSLLLRGVDEKLQENVLGTHASIVAIPPTDSGNCRLICHMETTIHKKNQELVLLRGDIDPEGDLEINLDVARVFQITGNDDSQNDNSLKLVDCTVVKTTLYSLWRSNVRDLIVSHPNPAAFTGPRLIPPTFIHSLNAEMPLCEDEDRFTIPHTNLEAVDKFYLDKFLLPARFSRSNILNGVSEFRRYDKLVDDTPSNNNSVRNTTDIKRCKYRELLYKAIADEWSDQFVQNKSMISAIAARTHLWQSLLQLCIKHWRIENVPIGFASNASMHGTPVVLRRNRISLLVPSSHAIASTISPLASDNTNQDCLRFLYSELLPLFDNCPSSVLQVAVVNDLVGIENQHIMESQSYIQSLVSLAKSCASIGPVPVANSRKHESPNEPTLSVQFLRSFLQFSRLLGDNTNGIHAQVLSDLVDSLLPSPLARSSRSSMNLDRSPSGNTDDDTTMVTDGTSSPISQSTTNSLSGGNASTPLFGSQEASLAFGIVTMRTVAERYTHTLRVVLFLAHLLDTRSVFLESSTLNFVAHTLLPKAIGVLRTWSLNRLIVTRPCVRHTENDDRKFAARHSVLYPPLLQRLLVECTDEINAMTTFQTIALYRRHTIVNGQSSDPLVLAMFVSSIVEFISSAGSVIIEFLKKHNQHQIIRSILLLALDNMTQLNNSELDYDILRSKRQKLQDIGSSFAQEGQDIMEHSPGSSNVMKEYALLCFKRAMQCFNAIIALPPVPTYTLFDIIQILKDSFPRSLSNEILKFLWSTNQALEDRDDNFLEYLNVNLIKYAVEVGNHTEAQIALMRLSDYISNNSMVIKPVRECLGYLIKECFRHKKINFIVVCHWGNLEESLQEHLCWQADNSSILPANTTRKNNQLSSIDIEMVRADTLEPSGRSYYEVLYLFYMHRHQYAQASRTLYNLASRIKLLNTATITEELLHLQHFSLMTAYNILLTLKSDESDDYELWILQPPHNGKENSDAKNNVRNVVTFGDIRKEVTLIEGKIHVLVEGNHQQASLVHALEAQDVIALLVELALSTTTSLTTEERQLYSINALEHALQICKHWGINVSAITRSIAMRLTTNSKDNSMNEYLLQRFLESCSDIKQYEEAFHTIIAWHGRNALNVPKWLFSYLVKYNPRKVLHLLIRKGLLLEGLEVASSALPMDILTESEQTFSDRASGKIRSTPYLPYQQLDSLVFACETTLKKSTNSSLKEKLEKFRDLARQYLQYITFIEEATVASERRFVSS